ncbi:MAG: HNH endonuclease [Acidimicrobiia bacterium]
MDGDNPVFASQATRAIPPAIRDTVLFRDGGCTIDGCNSRYRLEPHHIIPRSEHGTHHPSNLTTLCWYHHHVAIHGNGFRIDTESPPHKRSKAPLRSRQDVHRIGRS